MAREADKLKFVGKEEYAKGLEDVITNESSIGYVEGTQGWLIYRGIDIGDLAEHSNFEETVYLLLYGALPKRQELADFKEKLLRYREVPKQVFDVLRFLPRDCHPMAALRTGISALGTYDAKADEVTVSNCNEIAIKLTSQMATVAAAIARLRKGKEPVAPDPTLDLAANFLYMMNGKKPDAEEARLMDICLMLHADHENNASTFSTMVVISSLSDLYSAVVGGIGSLKGPLHGGANEQVMEILLEIGDPGKAETWIKNAIARKVKIMGFGHRVYKAYDPRARILNKYAKEFTARRSVGHLYEIAQIVEREVIAAYGGKGIFPNVDFYSGLIYHAMGVETAMYTPIFAVSRISGWVARDIEYLADNRIFRPRSLYTGVLKADYIPMDKR